MTTTVRSSHTQTAKKCAIVFGKHQMLLSLTLCVLLVSGCMAAITTQSQHLVEQPTTLPLHLPFRVIQVCLDTPPLYPATLFTQAANTIADWIEAAVTSNQDGFVVYVGEVTSNSFQSNSIAPIQVPAIPADPVKPTPIPTYTPTPGQNPYATADIQATRDASNDQMLTNWQAQVVRNNALVTATLTKVKVTTNRLRTLVPVYDPKAADLWGCFADASAHYSGIHGETYLIIASAWINNTSVNEVSGLDLHHAHVRGIFRPCDTAKLCEERDTSWNQIITHFGAQDVMFYDAAQSGVLVPLF